MNIIKKLPPWSLTIVIMGIILYLTLVPHPLPDNDIELFEGADKVVHAIMFGALAGAIGLDYSRRRSVEALTLPFLVSTWVLVTLIGGVIELLQYAMDAGRGCELWDFVADSVGALVAVCVLRYVARLLVK